MKKIHKENLKSNFLFTVFTPTYNRAKTLPRVYNSLLMQKFRNFEWLVVDDGSTDNTREIIQKWQKDAWFPVRYFWQPNQHKKTAFNRAVKEAKGELFLTIDSDDELLPEALDIFQRYWFEIPVTARDRYSAVTGLCVYPDGKIVGDMYPYSPFDSDSLECYHRWKIEGEKCGFQRTDILRKFPFPEEVKGLVPESYVWFAIARAGFITRYINEIVRIYHQTEDSIIRSKGVNNFNMVNADGRALFAKEQLTHDLHEWFWINPKDFLKSAAWSTRFHIHLLQQQRGKKYPVAGNIACFLVLLMLPIGFIYFLIDKQKLYKETNTDSF